jgi:ABC-type transport system involved in cytochrome c biogenesis permease subunit
VRLQFIAMIAFVLCVLSGSNWAAAAWGHYWSWDPKETWSLLLALNIMIPTFFVLKYAQFNWLKLSMLSLQVAVIILVAMMDRIFPGLHSYRMLF